MATQKKLPRWRFSELPLGHQIHPVDKTQTTLDVDENRGEKTPPLEFKGNYIKIKVKTSDVILLTNHKSHTDVRKKANR